MYEFIWIMYRTVGISDTNTIIKITRSTVILFYERKKKELVKSYSKMEKSDCFVHGFLITIHGVRHRTKSERKCYIKRV